MKKASLLTFVLLSLNVCACTVQTEVRSASQPGQAEDQRELTRDGAVTTAKNDAYARYGQGWIAKTDVRKTGRFWIVELRSAKGRGVRYAITDDGAIKERSTVN